MPRLGVFGVIALLSVGCGGDPQELEALERQSALERVDPTVPDAIAAPVIRRFTATPNIVDQNTPTPVTFDVVLAPWSGPPVVCKIAGVGVVNGNTTVTLTLEQSKTFTVSCKAPNSGTATAATLVRALPPVVGPEPSSKAVIFYYPWYGNPQTDGEWFHWNFEGTVPPLDITSRYYPALGPYSSNDPETIAQHCAWLRRAGVGVMALSWWGIGSYEDRAAAGILEIAARYRIAVTFHIEPYEGRSDKQLEEDIAYLNRTYGGSPAFYRSTGTSRHNLDYSPKGVFFLWSPSFDYNGGQEVNAEYWREAVDAIHAASDSSLVIANQTDVRWVDGGHFDGLYNYGTLEVNPEGIFDWATGMPPGSWYVPSVLPGAVFWNDTAPWPNVPRRDGATYTDQWEEALGTGVQPHLVTITSFNEWHEGTQIEPPASGVTNSAGVPYPDYAPLAADAYIDLTANEVTAFANTAWPQIFPGRLRLRTTSDWTVLRIESGAGWLRPETLGVSPGTLMARMENGKIYLVQPIENAEAGMAVELTIDLAYSGITYASTAPVTFAVERGWLGATTVTLWNNTWGQPYEVANFTWSGIAPDPPNTGFFPIPVASFLP
jgi:glycoprotein endo-alpha-1,2-mannosidase